MAVLGCRQYSGIFKSNCYEPENEYLNFLNRLFDLSVMKMIGPNLERNLRTAEPTVRLHPILLKNCRISSDPIGICGKLPESLASDSDETLLRFSGSDRILYGSFVLECH